MSRIHRIEIRNLKSIEHMDQLVPDGPIIYVIGPNEAGKTATLDALVYTLQGKGSIPAGVVRNGAEKSDIRLTLDDGRVLERTIRGDKAYLKVLDAEGQPVSSPQAAVGKLVGPISMDPWAFCNMKDSELQTAILRAEGMEDQLAALDGERATVYSARRDAGRDLTAAQNHLSALDPPPADLPTEPLDTMDLGAELDAMQKRGSRRELLKELLDGYKIDLARVQEMINRAKEELAALGANESLNERILTGKLDAVVAKNRSIQEATVYRLRDSERREAEKVREGHNRKYLALEKQRAALLAGVDLGIPGLKLEADGSLTVNEILFSNLNTAQRLKIACSFAMKKKPGLDIILIPDGSLLDQKSRAFLDEMAREKGFTIWIEVVHETGESGLLLVEELPKPLPLSKTDKLDVSIESLLDSPELGGEA